GTLGCKEPVVFFNVMFTAYILGDVKLKIGFIRPTSVYTWHMRRYSGQHFGPVIIKLKYITGIIYKVIGYTIVESPFCKDMIKRCSYIHPGKAGIKYRDDDIFTAKASKVHIFNTQHVQLTAVYKRAVSFGQTFARAPLSSAVAHRLASGCHPLYPFYKRKFTNAIDYR